MSIQRPIQGAKLATLLVVALTGVVFVLDLLIPVGVADWLGYLIPLLIASRVAGRLTTFALTAGYTVLIALGFILSPPGMTPKVALINCAVGVLALWISALLLSQRKQAEDALLRAHDDLDRRVQERTAELTRINEALRAEVAEHQRTTKALQESEDRYRSLVEFAPEAIAVHREGRWVYINPAGVRLLGAANASEILGRPVLDFVHPDDLAALRERSERVDQVEGGETRQTPQRAGRVVRLDGQIVHVEAKGIPTSYQGEPAVLVLIQDITKRKQAEEERERLLAEVQEGRRRAEELAAQAHRRAEEAEEGHRILEALLDHIPEGITIAEVPDVRIRMVSRYGRELTGRPSEVIEGIPVEAHSQAWQIYLADGLTPAVPEQLPLSRATLRGEIVTNEEYILRRPDGEAIPILCNAGPIRDRSGSVTGGVIAWRDIRPMKRHEQELQEAAERLRLALRAAKAGSWDWNVSTGEVAWSDECFAVFGLVPGGLLPSYNAWLEYVHPDDRGKVHEAMARAIQDHREIDIEFRIIRPDREIRWLNERGHTFYDVAGRPARMLGIVMDVTDRKQMEEALHGARDILERRLADRTAELTGASQRLQAEIARHGQTEEEIRKLGQTLERRARELVALDKAGRVLNSSLDLEAVLRLLIGEVRSLLGTEGVAVLQHDTGSDDLLFIAAAGAGLERLVGQRLPASAGIVGCVFRERRAVVVDDVRSDPRFHDRLYGLAEIPLHSMLAMPLISKGVVTGVLETVNKMDGRFSEDDLQILAAIANAAAVAIENSRLYTAEQSRRRQLEAVRAVTGEITRELDLAKVLGIITRRAAELIGAGAGTVWLWDEEQQALLPRAALRPGQDWSGGRRARLGEGAVGIVAEQRQGLIVNEYQSWPRALPYVQDYGKITALVGEPLLFHDRLLGVLIVDNEGTGRTFTREDGRLLALFASHAAVAIENARLFQEVQTARERLEVLSRKLVEVQEAERRHIARELHDEIGQSLTGLKLILDVSERVSAEQVKKNLGDSQALVNALLGQVREMSLDLRPAMLDDLGLLPAFVWYFERYRARTKVQVIFKHVGLEGRRFPSEVETATYRVVQEALTNVARHAKVGEVTVRLWSGEEALGVQIEDGGVGFDPETASHTQSSGLAGMRERSGLVGGRMAIQSAPGEGTCVVAEFPIGGAWRNARDGGGATCLVAPPLGSEAGEPGESRGIDDPDEHRACG